MLKKKTFLQQTYALFLSFCCSRNECTYITVVGSGGRLSWRISSHSPKSVAAEGKFTAVIFLIP